MNKNIGLKEAMSIGNGGMVGSGINNLLWISYNIMLSLCASAFGSYAPNLFQITGTEIYFHIYATSIIVWATGLHL